MGFHFSPGLSSSPFGGYECFVERMEDGWNEDGKTEITSSECPESRPFAIVIEWSIRRVGLAVENQPGVL